MAKKPTRKTIVKKLDKLFSLYIRTRYAKNEIAECITCGKKAHYKKLQAGHFMSRKNYATRWEEKNVEVQCYACNVMRYGEQYKFGLYLEKKHGQGTAEKLQRLSRQTVKFSNDDLLEKIKHYKTVLN
jgi:5-methylcytosine-specific restriction endonuclease McrA